MKSSHQWENRIIATGEEDPEQLLANPANFRRHPKHQQDALRSVLDSVGWVQDIIVNRTTGHIVDGHLRVELALRHNAETVPVKYVQLSADEESLILATFDPIGAMAVADRDQWAALIETIETDDEALQRVLDDVQAIEPSPGERDPLGDPDGWVITITCDSQQHQSRLMERLTGEGLRCRPS